MPLPNFLVIGIQRSGTTSLYHYLRQHPQIFMPSIKEPHFFSYMGMSRKEVGINFAHLITDFEEYKGLFKGVTNEKAIGEASTTYLLKSGVAQRIKTHIPEIKLIAIFRNPVDRAYSNYWLGVHRTRQPLSHFIPAVKKSEYLSDPKFVCGYLSEYFEIFNRDKIRVYIFEDFIKNTIKTMQNIFQYLGVEETYEVEISETIHHKILLKKDYKILDNSLFKNIFIKKNIVKNVFKKIVPKVIRDQLRGKLKNHYSIEPPPIPLKIRKELIEFYKPSVLELQDLIRIDLSNWLTI